MAQVYHDQRQAVQCQASILPTYVIWTSLRLRILGIEEFQPAFGFTGHAVAHDVVDLEWFICAHGTKTHTGSICGGPICDTWTRRGVFVGEPCHSGMGWLESSSGADEASCPQAFT